MADTRVVQVLDTNTANKIAAGEVVEKPASVVKELVENALDAGASQIDVTTFGGGTEYIRVVDNGCGMSEANARLAVLRHATSKIVKAEDLFTLNTLGFRGEALPSIASVSNFTLLTRPADEDLATSVHIDGGTNMEVSSTGGSAGTTVIVENLFFNVPARRKFLKTVVTEGRYISELLTKLALSRPDVRFRLVNNDKEVLHTPGDGDLQNTIRALYGRSVSQELLKVDFADPKIKIRGYIGKPTLLKGTRGWQTFFVNGRSIGNKMLAKAIDHAYQSQIPKSGFPFAVLNITLDTTAVDVNVHPQKSEIKFSDESLVYRAMFKALTDALTRPMSAQKTEITLLPDSELNAYVKPAQAQPLVQAAQKNPYNGPLNLGKTVQGAQSAAKASAPSLPPLRGSVSNKNTRPAVANPIFKTPVEPIFKEPEPELFGLEPKGGYDIGKQETVIAVHEARAEYGKTATASAPQAEAQSAAQAVTQTVAQTAAQAVTQPVAQEQPQVNRETIAFTNTDSGIATIWPIGQVDKTFIIAQSEDTLYLIDQHAAHERILYDKLVASHEQIPAQQLLIPLYMDMAADDIERITAHREEFLKLGVDVEAGGETMLRISSLPTDIKAEDAEGFIMEISKMLSELREIKGSDLRQEVLHMTACKAAIKAGQLLNMQQMRQLIIDLCNTTHPFTCPHGRPCMIAIDSNQLYKMFKRTGF